VTRTTGALDLDAYLARVGFEGRPAADLKTLQALHVGHVGRIPFENLVIQTGGVPSLEIEDLQAKLVTAGRGGYCFEQNTLFMAALREIGFDVQPREGRVMLTISARRPRTHMALEVASGGARYHADVGFGANGPLLPIPLDGGEHVQGDRTFRFEQRGDQNVLQSNFGKRWLDLVGLEPRYPQPVDFEVANWFTATHPRSVFRTNLMADLQTPAERHRLQNRTYTHVANGTSTERTLGDDEVITLLAEVFGLIEAPGTRFLAFDEHNR